jgi:hypothetical protein
VSGSRVVVRVSPCRPLPVALVVRSRDRGAHCGHSRPRCGRPPRVHGARGPALGALRRCPSQGQLAGHATEPPGRVPQQPCHAYRRPGRAPRLPFVLCAACVDRTSPRVGPRDAPARAWNRAPSPCRRHPHGRPHAAPVMVHQLLQLARQPRRHGHRPRPNAGCAVRGPRPRCVHPVEQSCRSASQHLGALATVQTSPRASVPGPPRRTPPTRQPARRHPAGCLKTGSTYDENTARSTVANDNEAHGLSSGYCRERRWKDGMRGSGGGRRSLVGGRVGTRWSAAVVRAVGGLKQVYDEGVARDPGG